jgi:hypothetical protein
MGQKSSNRAEKNRRRLEKRRREMDRSKKRQIQDSVVRPELRVVDRSPVAWYGEMLEDVAVFDDSIRQTLSDEMQSQAVLIRQALEEVCDRIESDAQENLASISRRSPYADWRLLIRGLAAWFNGDQAEAQSAWERLDPSRRPWRIAAALMLAKREDLTEIKLQGLDDVKRSEDAWVASADSELLATAKVTRQVYIERIALRAAHGLLRITPTDSMDHYDEDYIDDEPIEPEHFKFLLEYSVKYTPVEPELVRALQCGFIKLASNSDSPDFFELVASTLPGPVCDPRNKLIRFLAYFQIDLKACASSQREYVDEDLLNAKWCSDELRGALSSMLHCMLAAGEMSAFNEKAESFFERRFFSERDRAVMVANIKRHFENAIKVYPKNRDAYEGYEALIGLLLNFGSNSKKKVGELEKELAGIWRRRLECLPDDVEYRIKLVEHLLNHGDSDQAKKHVDILKGTRFENPLLDCINWRWHWLEIGRLSEKRTMVALAVPLLDELEKLWPKWLHQRWIPYLKAALKLRMGDETAFENIPEENKSKSALTAACMQLGAAQYLSLPAVQLKELREGVDVFLKDKKAISDEDLLSVANFFWDLTSAEIRYSAYRLHAPKFLKELNSRSILEKRLKSDHEHGYEVRNALLVMATDKIFTASSLLRAPRWMQQAAVAGNTTALATLLLAKVQQGWSSHEDMERAKLLKKEVANLSDPFYRFYYTRIIKQFEEAALSDPFSNFM